jgi:hypothetical protein
MSSRGLGIVLGSHSGPANGQTTEVIMLNNKYQSRSFRG